MPFDGLRIVSLESRRANLVEDLVRQQGGDCFNAPSVRELPLEENEPCLQLARDLAAGSFEALVLTTGVGAQYLIDAAAAIGIERLLIEALKRITTVSRGPKPAAVLRQYGAPATMNVPEPNTWRQVADAMRGLPVKKVAVQEYGVENPELVAMLEGLGFEVTSVAVYRWAMPKDLGPLREAARRIATGQCDIGLFLSSVQLTHVLEAAEGLGLREALLDRLRRDVMVASIGPVMTEALARLGLEPDFEPKHPKLAICIRQLADEAASLVEAKRRRAR
jgi:uroporphyrinogen-III synthase